MNYPDCKLHAGRVAELVCLTNECPKRLTLQCTICINSTCKRHNWKLMQQAIEEIFELCENEESKDQKRKKTETGTEAPSVSTKQEVQRLLSEFSKKLKMKQEEVMANADLRAKGLLAKNQTPEKLYFIVKNKINDFRKSNDRSVNTLDNILNLIKPWVVDDENGSLTFSSQPSSTGIMAPEVKQLQYYLNSILEGPRLARTNSMRGASQESPQKGGHSEQQLDELKQHYESQINGLIQQVKSIPILKSRIQAINLKLQAKDQKLKKYEQGTSSNNLIPPKSTTTSNLKSSQIINEKVKESQERAKRIQKLLQVRQNIKSMMYQYAFKNQLQQIQVQKVLGNEDALSVDIKNVYEEAATYLNQAMVIVADQLNYLNYSDRQDGEPYVEIQIIGKKGGDYKSGRTFASDRDPFEGRPFGTFTSQRGPRTYFPSYY